MKITFPCKKCGHKLKAGSELAGKRAKCTRCQEVQRVPTAEVNEDEVMDVLLGPGPEAKPQGPPAWQQPAPVAEPSPARRAAAPPAPKSQPTAMPVSQNTRSTRRVIVWIACGFVALALLLVLLAVNIIPSLNANRKPAPVAEMAPPGQQPAKEPPKEKWKPWLEEPGFVASDNQRANVLSADYLPLEAPFRLRHTTFYDKGGQTDMLIDAECSFTGSGAVNVQTLLTVTKSFRMDGRGLHRPKEERYEIDNGFVKHGKKVFKDNQLKDEVWTWERTLKIGAKLGDSWPGSTTEKDLDYTVAAFGTYQDKRCAIISIGDFGFYILGADYGEIERKHFEAKRLTFRISCH